jgi:hypothetical protein
MERFHRFPPVALAALWLGIIGCAREVQVSSGPSWVGEIGADAASGVVRRMGNEPFVRTVLQDESAETSVVVAGPYEIEIGRLAGARVSATGRFARSEELGRHLAASSYEILSVDGVRPHVGTLELSQEGRHGFVLTTPGGEAIPLTVLSEGLESALGGRVWVTLDESQTVTRYGVLRTPEEMAELEPQEPAGQS